MRRLRISGDACSSDACAAVFHACRGQAPGAEQCAGGLAPRLRQAARPRAQVREYSKAEEAEQAEGASGHSLREEADGKRRQMEQWSASAYGEVPRARQL